MSENLKKISISIRKNILLMAKSAGSSSAHIGGALSIADVMSVLVGEQMKLSSKKNGYSEDERDRIILSKGHGCLAYYAGLFEFGFLSKEDLVTFEKNGSELLGHPVRNKKKGIDFSTGSLGMGLSLGIGVALAAKKKNKSFSVYVILGDGECNEGSVWEAAMSAAHFKLDNVTIIIDNNNFQQTGSNEKIMSLGNIKSKWESFGWHTEQIDGNNIDEILSTFKKISEIKKPKAIIAKTIKGKGVSFIENNNVWHHSILTQKKYDEAINELNSFL
jgi:transketolase|tara:strand:- start:244 stop:1068 length:825 start_codon:yes stop_codon:yes gene_type:complete